MNTDEAVRTTKIANLIRNRFELAHDTEGVQIVDHLIELIDRFHVGEHLGSIPPDQGDSAT